MNTNYLTNLGSLEKPSDIIDLGVIQVDSDCPTQLSDVLVNALKYPFNSYSSPAGLPHVRRQVASGLIGDFNASSLIMTSGASGAFLSFILSHIENKHECRIALPDPGYPGFAGVCRRLGIKIDRYKVNGSRIDLDSFNNALFPNTVAAILISPGNPTGRVLDSNDLSQAESLAAGQEIPVLLDLSYLHLVSDFQNVPVLAFLDERSVQIYSFSKAFALSGFRSGALVANTKYAEIYAKTHFSALLSAPTIGQLLAARCVQSDVRKGYLDNTRDRLKQRYDELTLRLSGIDGVTVDVSDIGLFAWIRLPQNAAVVADLLRKQGFVVVPGYAFGERNDQHIRVLSDVNSMVQSQFVRALRTSIQEASGNE